MRASVVLSLGKDKPLNGIVVNEKCKVLAQKVKEIIDTKSSYADWLNNQNVRDQLKYDIKVCLIKNGYPPQYSPQVFSKVMEQAENFTRYSIDEVPYGSAPAPFRYASDEDMPIPTAAEPDTPL